MDHNSANHTVDARKFDCDEISISLESKQHSSWALWIEENILTDDDAVRASITPRGWYISWRRTVLPVRTLRWTSARVVRHTVATGFSWLSVGNLTSRTFIYSEVLTNWTCSSATMKRWNVAVRQRWDAYNKNVSPRWPRRYASIPAVRR